MSKHPVPFSFGTSHDSSLSADLPTISVTHDGITSMCNHKNYIRFSSDLNEYNPLSPFAGTNGRYSSSFSQTSTSKSIVPSNELIYNLTGVAHRPKSEVYFPITLGSVLSTSPVAMMITGLRSK